jgi:hypothetical protein
VSQEKVGQLANPFFVLFLQKKTFLSMAEQDFQTPVACTLKVLQS